MTTVRRCSNDDMPPRSTLTSEIPIRILSGTVMAVVSIAMTYLGGWYFAALLIITCLGLNWEWWRLVGLDGLHVGRIIDACSIILAIILMMTVSPGLALAALALGFSMSLLFCGTAGRPLWSAFGQTYIGLPALAILWFRLDPTWGIAAVLFLFAVVWSTDSAAYFAGKLLGGRKLWPRISPNKTWSGFIGGTIAGTCAGVVFSYLAGLPALLELTILSFILAIATQCGDLMESGMKRAFGIKDTSQLIPGHGGLLDRLDGLIVALLAAALIALMRNKPDPAMALLIWT